MAFPFSGGSCESRHTKRGREEPPQVRGQGQQPRVPGCEGTGTVRGATLRARSVAAGGSYTASKVRGSGREETTCVRGQGRPRGDTPRRRSGVAGRSHLATQAKGSDPEEPPRARGQGRQLGRATHSRGQGLWPGGASRGAVAAQVLEGLEELSHVEGQERRR